MDNLEITALKAALPSLSAKDQNFASSLLNQFASKGGLSEKQMFWVKKLGAAAPVVPAVNLARIVTLFDEKAGQGGAIVYQGEIGPKMRLSRLGEKSQYVGDIAVTSPAKNFADRTFFGRIDQNGAFHASRKLDQDGVDGVVFGLKQFAADPAKAAADYGHQHGNCCFCCHDLDNPASIALGYGPVCAKKWGLPHTYTPAKPTLKAEAV